MSAEKTVPDAFAAGAAPKNDLPASEQKTGSGALALGGLAALVASACCLAPLVLVSVGLGGAWMANLQMLSPYRWVFLAAAAVALVFAYRRIYRPAAECEPGEVCALPQAKRTYKLIFWFVGALVLASLSIPYWVPLFY